jgi:hypothetical protein
MRNEVVDKLRAELKEDLKHERQVSYIVTLMRKLLQHNKAGGPDYLTLRFFCDWALHVRMDRAGSGLLLEYFDAWIPHLIQHGPTLINSPPRFGFIFQFQLEMIWLLDEELGVEQHPARQTEWFFQFLPLFLKIISECPLEYKKSVKLRYIETLKIEPDGENFIWHVTFRDGTEPRSWSLL